MKKNIFFLILSISLFTGLAYYFQAYQKIKRDSLVLKLKLNLSRKNKKETVAWNTLKTRPVTEKKENAIKKPKTEVVKQDLTVLSAPDLETHVLAHNIQTSLKKHWQLDQKGIEQSLNQVDELISRHPSTYSGYKAKLILLLAKENLSPEEIDEYEISDVLFTMSEFNTNANKLLKKEAFLIAQNNNQVENLINQINKLESQREETSDPDIIKELEDTLSRHYERLDLLEDQLENGFLEDEDYINEDVIEISFMRALAQGRYDSVLEESEILLKEFPDSLRAHFYLIRALELSGRSEEAISYIENIELNSQNLAALSKRLENSRIKNPKDYWKRLRF